MSIITFLFSLFIFILINKTKEYYNVKYGNILLDYYAEEYCINSPVKRIKYPINETEYITVLNSEGYPIKYEFSFDYFSSSIYYTNETGEEDEEDPIYKRSLNCNGLCYKRQENSDILMDPEDQLVGYYPNLTEKYKYYSCIYNNIITSATISIDIYNDAKCKNKVNNNDTYRYEFKGNETCWEFNETYSLRPLYFEDGDKKIYYHPYNSNNCTSTKLDYFIINDKSIECNKKCHKGSINTGKYYKCNFNPNSENFISQTKIILFLYLFMLLFEI